MSVLFFCNLHVAINEKNYLQISWYVVLAIMF